jgi:pyruvate dehydrogenase E2 component (dihydrolipoamide acetyltransferase)
MVINLKTAGSGRIAISPRARRLAEQMNVDWTAISGTGRDGRIREIDIRSAAEPSPDQQTQGPGQVVTVGPIRKAIARRLGKASLETVPVTLFRSVRAEALVALRAAEGVSYSDILVNLVAACLRDHPVMNSTWTSEGIWYPDDVNISLAVDTDAGLLAPVILQADRLSLAEISATSSSLAEKAQAGQLRQSDLQGGTFTISNLGMHGVEQFTPILNPPQCSTLGVGTITPEPVCEGEDIIAGLLLHLSLTFDHRIVDGAPAARFLEDICQRILQV